MLEISEKTKMFRGIYSNCNFMNAMTAYIGNIVKVHTISGEVFEGIFRTFSPYMDIVIELAHDTSIPLSSQALTGSVIDKLIFSCEHVSYLEIEDAENDSITRDEFLNDNAISKLSIKETLPAEKILEPWDCSGENVEYCELSESEGWSPKDMFEKNEHLGVTSDFSDELTLYTTPLQLQQNPDKSIEPNKSKKMNISTLESRLAIEKSTKKTKTSRKSQLTSSSASKDGSSLKIQKSCLNNKNFEKESESFENFKTRPNDNSFMTSSKKNKLTEVDIKPTSKLASGNISIKSNLNPFAEEFVPACMRPSPVNCQQPVSLSPRYAAPQTPSSSFQPPVSYQSFPFLSWNCALLNNNNNLERH